MTQPRFHSHVLLYLSETDSSDQGVLKFEVKWEGYEKKADRTWEPEENLMYGNTFWPAFSVTFPPLF